jgi:dihydrofolate reductase
MQNATSFNMQSVLEADMGKVRVRNFSISLDGFAAGPRQSLQDPLGVGGEDLHTWAFAPDMDPVDKRFADAITDGVGAWVMGRNMFGPVRGEWPDVDWKGWWGPNPPYHTPVFVLTHHARPPFEMEGGNSFHFVTEGAEAALERAKAAAGDLDVGVGGGASTVRQYLEKRLIDELHLVVAPVLLGSGEPLLAGLDLLALGYELTDYIPSSRAAHMVLRKV